MVKTSEARDEVDVPMVGVEDEVNAMGKAWVLPPHCFFWVGSELDSLPQIRVGLSVVQICISFCDIHLNTPGLEAALLELMPASKTATTQGQGTCTDI